MHFFRKSYSELQIISLVENVITFLETNVKDTCFELLKLCFLNPAEHYALQLMIFVC